MIIEYQCECGEKFDKMYKSNDAVKVKIKCKKCGKLAKRKYSIFDYKMKDGTRNRKKG